LLTLLLNDLARWTEHAWIVLDDYHVLTTPAIHEGLAFFVEHLPPTLHLVIASRSNPLLPLSRLRARGQLNELRAADLRFTQEEAAEFLAQAVDAPLSAADVAALEARTEGWVAGLQLAALSMRGRSDVSRFLQAFTGSHVYIIDYLMEEVLQQLPPQVEEFLLHTAILERFNAALCEATTGQKHTQAMLESLERANLFVVPLDTERQWYRYHHLFADVLRHRLQQTQPEGTAALHGRASAWLEANDLFAEAIHHALAAADFARAAELITHEAEPLLKRGGYMTLQRWMDRLPPDLALSRPRLCLFRASACVITRDLDGAQTWLAAAEQSLPTIARDEQGRILAEVAAIGTGVALNQGDFPRTLELARQALAQLPLDETRLRGEVSLHLGLAASWSGDPRRAVQAYTEASHLAQAAGDLHTALLAMFNLGSQQFMQGRLHEAATTYQQALQAAHERGAAHMPNVAALQRGLGELYYEWNDLETAAIHLHAAAERGEQGRLPRMMVLTDLAQARLQQAQGDLPGAQATIERALRLCQAHNLPPRYASPVAAYQARLWLAAGNLGGASAWAQRDDRSLDEANMLLYESQFLVKARILIAQGKAGQARQLVERLRQAASAVDRVNSIVEILAVAVQAQLAEGDRPGAEASLLEALLLAAPGGYIRTFVDEGEALQQVLATLRRQTAQPSLRSYVERLLAAVDAGDEASVQPVAHATSGQRYPTTSAVGQRLVEPLIEPLSERELEVLRLVAGGLSDRQAAEKLIVAIGTVKRHLNNIYGKLGVHSRTHALARAKELGLL
jgi:LuxR family maltose regulon positive regulatory protein